MRHSLYSVQKGLPSLRLCGEVIAECPLVLVWIKGCQQLHNKFWPKGLLSLLRSQIPAAGGSPEGCVVEREAWLKPHSGGIWGLSQKPPASTLSCVVVHCPREDGLTGTCIRGNWNVGLPVSVSAGQPLCPVPLTLCKTSQVHVWGSREPRPSAWLYKDPLCHVLPCPPARAAFHSQESRNFIPEKLELQVRVLNFPFLPSAPHSLPLPPLLLRLH